MSYLVVKKKLVEVVMKLGIDDIQDEKEEVSDVPTY